MVVELKYQLYFVSTTLMLHQKLKIVNLRRISQSEIQNSAAAEKRGRAKIHSPQPPAGGTGAEAGRIHIPNQMFRPAESALVFRIFRKMGSNFFKQTPPFQICRRSCLGASRLGSGFRQEIPRAFEIHCQNSRRESAVPKRSLDCAKGARADEKRFLEIVGVSAMPLSI